MLKKIRFMSIILSLTILFSLIPANALVADDFTVSPDSAYSDIQGHWAQDALERAAENGWLKGDASGMNPDGTLTRAQLSAIVRRIFCMEKLEDLTGYTDVPSDAWYAEDMAAARRMQVIFGSDMKMRPNDAITRQEAFCVLARLMCMQDGNVSSLNSFSDVGAVSSWAKGAVAALVERKYAAGSKGKINPKSNITRAEIVTMLNRMIAQTASESYEGTVDGNLLVTAPDTVIKNTTVNGDLILADSINIHSFVTFENVHVTGNVVLRNCADKTILRDEKTVIDGSFAKNEQLSYTIENLGSMNQAVYTMYCDGGKDKDGKNVVYMVNTGTPATLIGIRPETGEQILSVPLEVNGESIGGAWGVMVHSSGDVYLAGYTNAYLFRYSPKTGKLENLGFPTKNSTLLLVLTEDEDGVIWGSQATTSSVYSYNPKTNTFKEYDLGGKAEGQYHVCKAPGTDDLYISSRWSDGTAHIYRMNIKTGKKTELLPQKYIDTAKCIYDMRLVDGKLFCRTEKDSYLIVLDAATGEQITYKNLETGEDLTEMLMYGRAVSEKSPIENCVYFYSGYQFYKYNLENDTVEYLNKNNPDIFAVGPLNFSFMQLDDAKFPGWSFVSSNSNTGSFVRYNFESESYDIFQLDIQGNPTAAHSSILGNNGKVYYGGYIGSSTGSYDPETGKIEQLVGLRQIEGMGVYENYLFFGRYPNANIAKYDTTKPWNWDATSGNPYTVFTLGSNADDKTYPNQDRPYNLLGIPEEGMVVAASIPKQGYYGSAIGYHDMKNPDNPVRIDHTIVPDLSITSMAYSKRNLLFGTSIRPGSNTDPKATVAELFSYDFKTNKYIKHGAVIPDAVAYNAMVTAPDGKIWGLANLRDVAYETRLFVFDPVSNKIVFQKDISIYNFGATWYGFEMTMANDGKSILISNLYNTGVIPDDYRQTGDLYRLDLASKDVTVLIRDFGLYHVQDRHGNLYASQGTEIYKYILK